MDGLNRVLRVCICVRTYNKKTILDGKGFYRFFCMLYDNGSEERGLGMLYGMNSMFSI